MTYLAVLQDELQDARARLKRADAEGQPVVKHQIREIEREIMRYPTEDEANFIEAT